MSPTWLPYGRRLHHDGSYRLSGWTGPRKSSGSAPRLPAVQTQIDRAALQKVKGIVRPKKKKKVYVEVQSLARGKDVLGVLLFRFRMANVHLTKELLLLSGWKKSHVRDFPPFRSFYISSSWDQKYRSGVLQKWRENEAFSQLLYVKWLAGRGTGHFSYLVAHHGVGLPRARLSVSEDAGVVALERCLENIWTQILKDLKEEHTVENDLTGHV